MNKASIVSIGNEILIGRTIDTNAAYLAERLTALGIPVVSCYTVADDIAQIVHALELASNDADLIIATGGLGPTDDDLTRQGFAQYLNTELKLQDDLLQRIRDFFAQRGVQMPERNTIQAYIPDGAKPIVNNLGTAPGILAKKGEKMLIALPGVPSEMKEMFQSSILPVITPPAGGRVIVVRRVRCFGAGESYIASLLGDLMQRDRNPLINITVGDGIITLYVVACAESRRQAEQIVEKDVELLYTKLGKLIFGREEQTLAQIVGEKLTQQKKTLAVAESCTGGLLAKLITDIPGSSNYFTYGWVTYSDAAKTSETGVPAQLIDRHGAVSEQVASAMAQGARKKAKSDFAIAITGIAGPDGGTSEKPVGLVYIGLGSLDGGRTERFIFSHSRESVRLRAALTALNLLRLKLDD